MAVGASSVWEVRTGGSANNGGGFDSTISGAGTDYTQQNASQQNWDGVTNILSTVGVGSTTVISNTAVFTSAMVGNALHITAGTNFTAGFYFITSFTSTTQVVVDRTPAAAAAGSLGTGNVGGALALPSQTTPVIVGGNTIWVKSGTYTVAATTTPPAGSQGNEIIFAGYNSTRGDLDSVTDFSNFPTIVVNNVSISCFNQTNGYSSIRNFIGDPGSGGTKGLRFVNSAGGNGNSIINCKATGVFTSNGYTIGANAIVRNCLSTGISGNGFLVTGTGAMIINCVATACTAAGFNNNAAVSVAYIRCISYNNTGATTDGFVHTSTTGDSFINCIAYNNGRDGFHFSGAGSADNSRMLNCITAKNAGWGVNSATTTWNSLPQFDYTAYFSNTSGTTTGIPVGIHDIVLSVDPFTNAAGADFTLNNNNPGGNQLQNAANTSIFPGLTPTSFLDVGSYQHQGLQTAFVLCE